MEIAGAVFKAALACARRFDKDRPLFWAGMVRLAPRNAKTSYLEATDGVVLVRVVLEQPQECEVYLPREVVSRLRRTDVVAIEGRELSIDESHLRIELTTEPETTLPTGDGKRIRVWPDFDDVIPKGKRAAAPLIGMSPQVIGRVVRAAAMLKTKEEPVLLRVEAGGADQPAKLSGRSTYGDVVFAVMPVSLIPEEPKTPKDEAPDGKTAAAGKDA